MIEPQIALYKVLTWPLVACCSVKVKNPKDIFKPEYIIPQLLLQWVSQNLDGIKYSSTHIDLNKTKHIGTFHNVVLPVKTFDVDNGYCTRLKALFKATDVLPMQLRQFAMVIYQYSLSIVFLGISGAMAAKAGGSNTVKAVLRICIWGSFAMGMSALVGYLFDVKGI